MRVEHRKQKRHGEERAREPAGNFRQDIGRLRAEDILCHAATESRAQPFALRTLHQDHEDHEQADKHIKDKDDVKQNPHGDGQYGESGAFVKLLLMILILIRFVTRRCLRFE